MSRPTLDPALSTSLSLTGLSPSLAGFPKTVLLGSLNQLRGPNPGMHASRFGLFPFRSPLLWKSMFLSLPYLLLPEAFRSLSRLSSALSAKASTIRSFMHDQLALKAGGGFSARQEIYFLMCLKNPADICEANDIDRTGRSGDDRFKALPPLYSSKTHTYIALHALVFGQFFALFSSKCVIITNNDVRLASN